MFPRSLLLLSPFVAAVMLGRAASEPDDPAPEETGPMAEFSIDRYQWEQRPVLVFAPASTDPRYQHATRIFMRNMPYLEERDLVVVEAVERGVSRAGGREIPAEAAEELREAFKVEEGSFLVVLVGKDGTEKARWTEFEGLGGLFGAVDAMPMRRQEIRDRRPGSDGGASPTTRESRPAP